MVPSLWSVNASIFITRYNQNHKSKGFLRKPIVLSLPLQVEMPFYRATHPENTEVRGPSFVSPTVKPPSTGNSLLQQILKTWWSRLKRSMRHKTAHALHSNRIVFWATAIGQLCPESGYGWTGNQRKASKCSCRNSVQHKNQVIEFLIKQRLSLPASVSEALEEAWVPSAPQWLLHTTACPSKCHQDSRISKDFCMKRKKTQISQQLCCRGQFLLLSSK